MADFIYQEPFPVGEDKTQYRLLTKDYVKVVECDGRKILKVDPAGLELLSKAAYSDVSFYLRAAHLQKLRNILDDPEATDNDKFVAYTMLLNQVVAAEGELPTCQDTGTAICIGHKGEDVYTGADDAKYIAKGVYETYKDRNLRYSQVVPFTMTEEKNSGTNLPAQIDIYGGHPGMEYEFLFITKGGGSANKTFLYQQTKALLNEKSLTDFIKTHIFDLGTSACPPYHLAICIGGTSAEMCLSTVKKASAGYLDELPTSGNEGGRCFRDLEWEEKVLRICQQSGVGAQFGGKYLVHDVRVIRAPRHAASCPVAIGVSCSADRNIKAKITPEGIFLEQLEKNPARFLPKEAPNMSPAVDIDLDEGMDKVREILSKYPIKTRLNLKGTLIVARDIAHARIKQMIDEGTITAEEAVIGYVAAFPFAEVVSGYTAFYQGAKSVCPSVTMKVKYVNSWSDAPQEAAAASALADEGCVLISQHSDNTTPATSAQDAGVFHCGYNNDMTGVAPEASLISCRVDWTPYFVYAISAVANGESFDQDWTAGYADGSVKLTELNTAIAAPGTEEALEKAEPLSIPGIIGIPEIMKMRQHDLAFMYESKEVPDIHMNQYCTLEKTEWLIREASDYASKVLEL